MLHHFFMIFSPNANFRVKHSILTFSWNKEKNLETNKKLKIKQMFDFIAKIPR